MVSLGKQRFANIASVILLKTNLGNWFSGSSGSKTDSAVVTNNFCTDAITVTAI